ncbi:ATP-binding protein [Burkholderia multivorans]|uniref:AAA family ATPase n=1 Tax=Burkholderia multivorans TaxID=87883 RepID=UPI001C242A6A|nr:AAA family ATPase [Burkholderia multivorans]MBU9200409.1 ATP-binding protein [Burkholderia multivorans]MDN8078466.1 AAA family ATPase [Burkholderia multivorans]
MIESLSYAPVKEQLFPWAEKLDYLKQHPITQFKPGLNIIFGGNGSGKSTLLQMLATALAAEQGGTSVVTASWVRDLFRWGSNRIAWPFEVIHDGQPVMYFNARASEGLIGGGFDDDFFMLGVANTMTKGSAGQLVLHRATRLLEVIAPPRPESAKKTTRKSAMDAAESTDTASAGTKRRPKTARDFERKAGHEPLVPRGFPDKIEWKTPIANDAKKAVVDALLAPKCAQGPRTLLLDEPESGYSLGWQAGLWNNVLSKVDPEKFQVIVATHSPFALGIKGANYIEMAPGYHGESMAAMLSLVQRLNSQ